MVAIRINLHSHSPLFLLFISTFLFISFHGNRAKAQQCLRTAPQPDFNHSCPFFSREAYTIETRSPSGRPLYQKECCDRPGIQWSQAAVKGCIRTSCRPYSDENPCSSLPGYIINRQFYLPYQDAKRDFCPNQHGQVAICCPVNSEAYHLMSIYGAEQNEFPHQARLETSDGVCGGTIYNHNTIITAASCVVDSQGTPKNPRSFKLTLGTNIATSAEDDGSWKNVYPVEKVIVHPGHSYHIYHPDFQAVYIRRSVYNNIALLRLSRIINFSKNIKALPIAPDHFKPSHYGSHVTIVGWGSAENGVTSEYLVKANLLIRSDGECYQEMLGGFPYPTTSEYSDQLHCFGGFSSGYYSPVAGKGDTGGPAICRGPDGYAVLCGITLFGGIVDVCRRNMDGASCPPSAYTDVSYYRDWIRSNAGGQDWSILSRKVIFGDHQYWSKFPHQVKIRSDGGPNDCGGTLVSRDSVITAGHCVFTENESVRNGIEVLVWGKGVYRPRFVGVSAPGDFARYKILEGLKPRSLQGHTWIDNVALIKLNDEVPISLEDLPGLPAYGWSLMTRNVMELAWPKMNNKKDGYLVQRFFKVMKRSECKRRLEKLRITGVNTNLGEFDKYFCGVEEYSGGGVCDRFTGGGVICPGSGAGVLCGVQTFRFCDNSMPTVFLNLANYPDLISKSVWR